jgi:hypothetical protein
MMAQRKGRTTAAAEADWKDEFDALAKLRGDSPAAEAIMGLLRVQALVLRALEDAEFLPEGSGVALIARDIEDARKKRAPATTRAVLRLARVLALRAGRAKVSTASRSVLWTPFSASGSVNFSGSTSRCASEFLNARILSLKPH